jgi:DNA (cytosine-5)-methyltransferase 1
MPKMPNIQQRPVAVDLFAGAGGFSLGIEQAGFDVLVAVENDPVHAATYAFNFPLTTVLCADASTLTGSAVRKAAYRAYASHHPPSQGWNGQIDLVFGGPPCQGFSIIGKRIVNDERNSLVFHFYRLVTELSPRYFVMENVPGMAAGKHQTWLRQLKILFKKAGYRVQVGVLNAADFGVPQQRKRLFLIGTQVGGDSAAKPQGSADVLGQILCPKNQHKLVSQISEGSFPAKLCCFFGGKILPEKQRVTVGEAIADLPDLDDFPELKTNDEVLLSESQLLQLKEKTSFYAQMLRGLSEDSNFSYPRLWNPQLLTSSMQTQHNENSISRFAEMLPNQREPISHLRRLDINGLCHTLRAGTGHERGSYTSPRPIHPTLPRVISVREAARLHSFPDWFRFHQTKWHGFRQVGNAVPPLLAQALGLEIVTSLNIMPSVPRKPLELGNIQLLRFDRSEATHYWKSFEF